MVEKKKLDTKEVIEALNRILELELAGVVRYIHYSLMIFGHARIPLVNWMRTQATEGITHAVQAGEYITSLGGHPSLKIGKLTETHKHDIDQILREALKHERETLGVYYRLRDLVEGRAVSLEEFARQMILQEEVHISEVEKMIRQPGALTPAR